MSSGQLWNCNSNSWSKHYVKEGSSQVLQFRFSNLAENNVVQIQNYKGMILLSILYSATPVVVNITNGYLLVGDFTRGTVNFNVTYVTQENAGSYLAFVGINGINQCATIYLLGQPRRPSIAATSDTSEGQKYSITCTSSSTTKPDNHSLNLVYNWMIDGVTNDQKYSYSQFKQNLSISRLDRGDNGKNFTCTAIENNTAAIVSDTSDQITLNVLFGPYSVRFKPVQDVYRQEEGSSLSEIICEADCNPRCDFMWAGPNVATVTNRSPTLQLGLLTMSTAGKYKCTVTRPESVSSASLDLTVEVIYGPYQESTSILPNKTEYIVNENERITNITCQTACFPECSYNWTKQQAGRDVKVSNSSLLSLGTVNRTDAAIYICIAINSFKQVSNKTTRLVQIKVNYGPDKAIIDGPHVYDVKEGDKIPDKICTAECFPGCSFIWKNRTSTVSASSVLSLGTLTRQHSDNYTCISSNNDENYRRTSTEIIQVIVRYAPTVKTRFSSSSRLEGTSLTLYCDGEGNPSRYTYTGLKQTLGTLQIPNNNTAEDGTEIHSSIHFKKLQLMDTGSFICEMNNGVPGLNGRLDQTASVDIVVKVAPKVLTENLKFTGSTDGAIEVEIPFYCYPDIQFVKFIKNNNTVIENNEKFNVSYISSTVKAVFYGLEVTLEGFRARLTIADLKEKDFGNYTLWMKNIIGNTTVQLLIIAESVPTIPNNFRYLPGFEVPRFAWQEGFNGGHSQRFVIQTSIPDSGHWINQTNILEKDDRYFFNNSYYHANVGGLQPGTYTARLIAKNSVGEALPLELNSTFNVLSEESEKGNEKLTAAVAGGTVAALVVLVIVALVMFMIKRRTKNTDKETNRLQHKKKGKADGEEDSSDEDVVVENKMYESAGQVMKTEEPVYNKPKKNVKRETKNTDVYAVVDKTKGKEKQMGKEEKQQKKKQIAQGEIYENAPEKFAHGINTYGNAAFEDNPYENPEGSKPSKTHKKNINQDGLVYADLAFNEKPKGQKKLVIHGLDEMTTYVQVDFNKKADPLPDSDTEEQSTNKKN